MGSFLRLKMLDLYLPLPASKIDTMMQGMTNPKLDKALRALVVIDRAAVSSVSLAQAVGVSRPTAVRLVENLRELGCTITSERDGWDYWYRLEDWGVFSPLRVRAYVKTLPKVSA
jgi:biotin operon repressor